MKTRTGFVSNSSSSSFIIAVKEGDLKSNLNKVLDGIEKVDIPMKNVVLHFIRSAVETFINNSDEYTYEEYLDQFCYEESEFEECEPEIFDKVKNHGWKLYEGSVSDEDYEDMGSMMLVYTDIDHVNDEIIIKKEAGY